MNINIHATFLPHDDRDASVGFYCDKLGFELRNDVGYNGMHWLTVGPPGQPELNLVLFPPGADPGVTDDERRTIAEMMAKGTYGSILLATRTSTPPSRSCRPRTRHRAGAGPAGLGLRDFAVRDSSGNMLRIQEAQRRGRHRSPGRRGR